MLEDIIPLAEFAISRLPLFALRIVVVGLLLVFGVQWLRKVIPLVMVTKLCMTKKNFPRRILRGTICSNGKPHGSERLVRIHPILFGAYCLKAWKKFGRFRSDRLAQISRKCELLPVPLAVVTLLTYGPSRAI